MANQFMSKPTGSQGSFPILFIEDSKGQLTQPAYRCVSCHQTKRMSDFILKDGRLRVSRRVTGQFKLMDVVHAPKGGRITYRQTHAPVFTVTGPICGGCE